MLRIGLTGGIASGKSAAAAVFAGLGVPVIDSDVIAREVVAPDSPGLAAIRARFGDGVLQADGQLDRRALRAQVFADPAARRDLEALTHPLIRQRMATLSAAAGGPYQIHAIPLLVEGGAKRPGIDRVLVIDCPETLQIQRVMARDRVDEAGARAVLAAQATRAQRLAAAVFAGLGVPVIDSDVIAREVVAPGSPGLAAIRARFGDGVLQADGQLDRRALRAQVFADPAARRDLEALTHPLIRQKMAALSAAAGGPYQVHAIPLLVEGGAKRPGIDRVLVIDCPEALQIQRVMARDRVDEAGARAVLAAQATRAQRLAAADDVIVNDRGLEALQDAVTALHRRYLELAAVYAGRDPAAE